MGVEGMRTCSNNNDSDISALCGGNGFGEPGLVGGPALTALCVGYCAGARVADALEGGYAAVLGLVDNVVAVLNV